MRVHILGLPGFGLPCAKDSANGSRLGLVGQVLRLLKAIRRLAGVVLRIFGFLPNFVGSATTTIIR